MEVPDDIDDAIALFTAMAGELDGLLSQTEAEQEAGKSGYSAWLKAKECQDKLNVFGAELLRKIEAARATLS